LTFGVPNDYCHSVAGFQLTIEYTVNPRYGDHQHFKKKCKHKLKSTKKSVLKILLTLGLSLYGLLHTRHFCTQYCDKKIILSHGCLKAKVSSELKLAQGTIRFFLPIREQNVDVLPPFI